MMHPLLDCTVEEKTARRPLRDVGDGPRALSVSMAIAVRQGSLSVYWNLVQFV